jgi:uncharacterized membrane protein
MKINHFICARLSTNLTLLIFVLFALGIILWTSDEFLGWDILPDWIDNYAQLIIVVVGIFAFLLVVSSLLCSLMVLAELAAQQLGIQGKEFQLFTRKKLIIFISVVVVVLVTFFTLHKIDEYREESRLARNRILFKEKLIKQSKELENALSDVVTLFPEPIIQAIENKTFMEKPMHQELAKLLSAINASLPEAPKVSLLIPASHPYQYSKIWITYRYDEWNREYENGERVYQQFFTQLPNPSERELVEALFNGSSPPLETLMDGQFIDNTNPSAWGLLKLNDKVVSLICLEGDITGYERVREEVFHPGPSKLISNQ